MKKIVIALGILLVLGAAIGGAVYVLQNEPEFIVEVEMPEEDRLALEERIAEREAEMSERRRSREEITPAMYSLLAQDYIAIGRLSDAKQLYEQYLRAFAKDKNYIYDRAMLSNYGNILMRMGEYRKAEEVYRKILEVYTVSEGDALNYVRAIKAQAPTDTRVLTTVEAAIGVHGQTPALMSELAEWHERRGNCANAIASLQVIPQLDPGLAGVVDLDIQRIQETCGQ